ncbi:hypothetical protein RUM43_011734 [Polyplax serrata]|uniref:C2 domain-containing protein n=1 Tax=Polyplax serrata TaxID=468196 RepID=A0AAN8S6K8_POLSC
MGIFVWDYDGFPGVQSDDPLGRATLEINRVAKRGHLDTWVTLEQAKHGMVHLRMTWFRLSSNIEDLKEALAETQMLRVTSMSSALLMIYIDSIRNLPNARLQSKPDPYVSVTLCKTTKSTKAQWRTDSPVYEKGFTFLVHNPEVDTMHIKVTDNKTGKEIGELIYNISQLLEKPNMTVDSQPFQLKKSGAETKIILSMQLKVLKFELPLKKEPSVDGSVNEEADDDIVPSENTSVDSYLKKQDSFVNRRQGSIRSNKSEPTPSLSTGTSPPSGDEELIRAEAEYSENSAPAKRFPSRGDSIRSNMSYGSNTSEKGENGLGRILLTMSYNMSRQRFEVTVHRITGLPLNDPSNIPDPYVKLYLLPERNKDSKRKTEAIKDNCNPVYEQQFEYIISPAELSNRQLEVSVATRKKLFSSASNCMGQVLVNLDELDLTNPTTEWYDLLPEFHKDKDD